MLSETKAADAEEAARCYLARLEVEDLASLEQLEERVRLTFWGVDNYRKFLEDLPGYFGTKAVVLPDGGKRRLVGFYLARAVDGDLEVLKLGVLPGLQRRGIGTRLMDSCRAEGVRRGCSRCFLEVRKSNQPALQFYRAHGFGIAGTRVNYYTNPVEDAWVMEKKL
jgi:ribosomal-protein-alanine N-acetyltransferase